MRNKGFTLVELVAVIVILGILAVYVAPRFFTNQGDDVHAAQISLLSLLRLQQQRAMQDTENTLSYGVDVIESSGAIDLIPISPAGINVEAQRFANMQVVVSEPNLRFNASGCINTCGDQDITITIVGQTSRSVCINRQGFITQGTCQTS